MSSPVPHPGTALNSERSGDLGRTEGSQRESPEKELVELREELALKNETIAHRDKSLVNLRRQLLSQEDAVAKLTRELLSRENTMAKLARTFKAEQGKAYVQTDSALDSLRVVVSRAGGELDAAMNSIRWKVGSWVTFRRPKKPDAVQRLLKRFDKQADKLRASLKKLLSDAMPPGSPPC